jgi:glycosyltransferase involved in cell wall biosynthesis
MQLGMHSDSPDYSIVIPAYNEEELLPATLDSIRSAMRQVSTHSGEIVVTDNDSDDRTAEIATDAGARVVFEEHRQISRSRNVGGFHAEGRYLIFVDADTLITPELLRATLASLDTGEVCGGGTIVTVDPNQPAWVRRIIRWTSAALKLCKWACGAYVYCPKEAFVGVGGFDERYYASEEIHFSRSLKRWGRGRGMRFEILDEPIETSMRKVEWYSPLELLKIMLATALMPTRIRKQSGCDFWYTRPEAKPREEMP